MRIRVGDIDDEAPAESLCQTGECVTAIGGEQ